MAKSMKPGGGGRFAKMVGGLERSGKSAESAKAIAASAGRKKYGAAKMAKFAAAGKKRAHNTKIDAGSLGAGFAQDEMPMVPDEEMHAAKKAPHTMTNQDMFAKPDINHHLHSLIQEHSKQAALHAAKGAAGQAAVQVAGG